MDETTTTTETTDTNTLYTKFSDIPSGPLQIFIQPLCDAGLLDAASLNMHDETIRALAAIVRGREMGII